jgi:hypothetical protein
MLLPFSNSSICPRRIACLLEGEIFSLDIPSHRTSPITGIAPVLANRGKHGWVHLALDLSQVSAKQTFHEWATHHRLLGLGQVLLRAATRQGQIAKYGREGSGVQLDSDSFSLL